VARRACLFDLSAPPWLCPQTGASAAALTMGGTEESSPGLGGMDGEWPPAARVSRRGSDMGARMPPNASNCLRATCRMV